MREYISTDSFIKSLPAWVWVYQGHAHPDMRFFYRIPRGALYSLIRFPQGFVGDKPGAWLYQKASDVGCNPKQIIAFVHGEPVTYIAIEAD